MYERMYIYLSCLRIDDNLFKRNERLVYNILLYKFENYLFKIKHVMTNRVKLLTRILYVFKFLTSLYIL